MDHGETMRKRSITRVPLVCLWYSSLIVGWRSSGAAQAFVVNVNRRALRTISIHHQRTTSTLLWTGGQEDDPQQQSQSQPGEKPITDRDSLTELYKTVAEQDPEWFASFVTSVLGEDSVDEELLSLTKTTTLTKEDVSAQPDREEKREKMALIEKDLVDETISGPVEVEVPEEEAQVDDYSEQQEMNMLDDGFDIDEEEDDTTIFSEGISYDSDQENDKIAMIPGETDGLAEETSPSGEQINEVVTALAEEEEDTTSLPTLETQSESTLQELESSLVIMYMDLSSRSYVRISLVDVLSLGYSQSDVQSLEADALDLIATDGIRKPRSGVPSRWKVRSGKDDQVRILSKTAADEIIASETSKQKERQQGKRAQKGPEEAAAAAADKVRPDRPEEPVTSSRPSDERLSREIDSRRPPPGPRDPTQPVGTERGAPRTTKRERGGWDEPIREPSTRGERKRSRATKKRPAGRESRRRVYDGRAPTKSKRRKRDDPPTPNSPLWVDMNTFRDLLRSEAGLRLRILGDDWSDIVKEESDWRLDLYKEWLWTLHNGVGKPIVESRSDRMRRKSGSRNEDRDQGPLPPRRSKKGRER